MELTIKSLLEGKLLVGTKIKLGRKYAEDSGRKAGEVIELIEGHFEYDNGLYTEDQYAPSEKDGDDFNSIYHLFGNDLENFMDCSILNP